MSNTCSTCRHWYVPAHMAGTNNGQCRAMPPASSYSWPKTRSDEWCSLHRSRTASDTDLPDEPTPGRLSQDPPACEPEHRAAPMPAAPAKGGTSRPRRRAKLSDNNLELSGT